MRALPSSTRAGRCAKRRVGRTYGASSSICTRPTHPPSPQRCSIGSARSTPSKKRFAGDIQTNAAPSARNAAARRSMRCALGCSRRRSRSHANPRLPKRSSLRSIAGRRCAAFFEDGRIEIDNNAAERALRCMALGRQNFLFAGSDAGGERSAALYSLLSSANLNGLNLGAFLREVLARIANHPKPHRRTAAVESEVARSHADHRMRRNVSTSGVEPITGSTHGSLVLKTAFKRHLPISERTGKSHRLRRLTFLAPV